MVRKYAFYANKVCLLCALVLSLKYGVVLLGFISLKVALNLCSPVVSQLTFGRSGAAIVNVNRILIGFDSSSSNVIFFLPSFHTPSFCCAMFARSGPLARATRPTGIALWCPCRPDTTKKGLSKRQEKFHVFQPTPVCLAFLRHLTQR